jgi:hypothetical protein
MSLDRGAFVLSLDFELIWGTMDLLGPEAFRAACERERSEGNEPDQVLRAEDPAQRHVGERLRVVARHERERQAGGGGHGDDQDGGDEGAHVPARGSTPASAPFTSWWASWASSCSAPR